MSLLINFASVFGVFLKFMCILVILNRFDVYLWYYKNIEVFLGFLKSRGVNLYFSLFLSVINIDVCKFIEKII
jgi:hypothetical protein